MILSVCSNEWCRQVYGYKEIDKPGVVYSHGYCPECHDDIMRELEQWEIDAQRRREADNRL